MGSAMIKVFKKSGESFSYDRETVWADYYRGCICVDDFSFVKTKTIDELISKMKKHDIISYGDDFLDIDDYIESLLKQYGEDFEPDAEEWYKDENGYGTDGANTELYLEEYYNNKENVQNFIEKLKSLTTDELDKILLAKFDYDDEMDEDDVDPEMWILVNENGKLVEGEIDETDQLF